MNNEKMMKNRKKSGRYSVVLIVSAVLFLILLAVMFILSSRDRNKIMTDPGAALVPNISVTFSKLDNKNFYRENGMLYYTEGETVSKAGIDVSFAQKEIDWKKVSQSGIDFAIVRAGYRGYESGKLNLDEYFHKNMTGAQNAGIETGVYFYSQAVNEDEAVEEADFVLNLVSNYNITYPIAFDWETVPSDDARTDGITGDELNKCALAFCRRIEENGYKPVIYASLNLLREKFDKYSIDIISEYDLWLAEYKYRPEYPYQFKMWQYSDEGTIDGIDYPADINIMFE